MTTQAIKIGPVDHGRRMSLADFEHAEVQEGHLYELGRGVILVSDVPNPIHLAQFLAIRRQFSAYEIAHPGRLYGVLGGAECKIVLTALESKRHPDLAIYKTPLPSGEEDVWAVWIPELVIEIVSPGSEHSDYEEKRAEYFQFGVQEYWIVDAERQEALILRRAGMVGGKRLFALRKSTERDSYRDSSLLASPCSRRPAPPASDSQSPAGRNIIMPDLKDGESIEMQGSGSKPYVLKNVGGVYSCSCPAWRNQSLAIEQRTCKHLRKLRGDAAEEERIGGAVPVRAKSTTGAEDKSGPPLLLAERWDRQTDLTGWWMSEKLDGVRAYWDGKQFLSRLGNVYLAPDWFLEGLPDEPLDGELWLARKMFQRTVSIVRRQDKTDLWREVRYLVFDAPSHGGPFEQRVTFIQEVLQKRKPAFAAAHPHEACKSLDHLHEELARIEGLGGEGLMLRQPRSKYEIGRSMTLLKVKSFLDAEGRVIGHKAGAGRHKGRLGALQVELADGTRVDVGTGFSDAERENPPPIGSIITFRYQELSEAGVPRFPSYVGMREDVELTAPPSTVTSSPAVPASSNSARPSQAAPSTPASGKHYFELIAGTSNKFWEVWVQGNDMTTRWGRIGSAGQSKTKTFPDEAKAQAAADKLIAEKTADGYVVQHPK